MKITIDTAILVAIAVCYAAGQFFTADRFAFLAGILLTVLLVRLAGSTVSWIFGSK